MSALKFLCVMGSVRPGRMCSRVTKLVQNQFNEIYAPQGHELKILDPSDFNLPVLETPLHFYPDPEKAPEALHVLKRLAEEADGYLVVMPEYQRSIPPAITNTLMHLPPPIFEFKPSGIISYSMGIHGGALAALSARSFLAEQGCIAVKRFATIGTVHKSVTDEGTTESPFVLGDVQQTLAEVSWWARASKQMRDTEGIPSK